MEKSSIAHSKLILFVKAALAPRGVQRSAEVTATRFHLPRSRSARRIGGLAIILLQLTACASQPKTSIASTRDVRSQEYCSLRAQAAGSAQFDVGSACRRAEYVAKTRARLTHIGPSLDQDCEEEATVGQAGGPFSWRAYMRCIDNSI